jgi:cytidylate kinase
MDSKGAAFGGGRGGKAPRLLIAIDGPAASGKGTLARRLAVHFGLPHLDTGLLYRAVARRLIDGGGDPTDAGAAEAAARVLRAEDLARDDLRGPPVDAASSQVAAFPAVRAALLQFQRDFAVDGAVLDGRDIGTVVFPRAPVKFYVTASVEARARRRLAELRARGETTKLEAVLAEMRERDARDAGRADAPMRQAADAVVLDTTDLDADAVFARALAIITKRLAAG